MDGTEKINESVRIEVSEDRMSAVIIFDGPQNEGAELPRAQLIKEIEKSGIKKGIDKKILGEILSGREPGKKYLLAAGMKPSVGKNGEIILNFDVSKQGFKPITLSDGSVDFKNLDNITMAKQGELVAKMIEPRIGADGYDVYGEVLPGKEGKPVVLPRGRGTVISEDGTQLLAEVDGRIIYAEGKVSISDMYEIKGDVGPATGNITFNGSVVVRGNVQTEFVIRATGNVEVYGIIEGAEVYAGGNVLATNGISGVNKGIVQASGNVTSKSIQNATLDVKGDIFAEAIMHSNIKSTGKVEIGGQKGLLVGGELKCHNGVLAKVVGSSMGTKTRVHIGGDNDYVAEYNRYLAEHQKITIEFQENLHHLETMMKRRKRQEDSQEMSESVRNSLLNTINNTNQMKAQLATLQTKIDELKVLIETDLTLAMLSVEVVAYPGLSLRIGNAKTILEREESRVTFRNSEGLITTGVF